MYNLEYDQYTKVHFCLRLSFLRKATKSCPRRSNTSSPWSRYDVIRDPNQNCYRAILSCRSQTVQPTAWTSILVCHPTLTCSRYWLSLQCTACFRAVPYCTRLKNLLLVSYATVPDHWEPQLIVWYFKQTLIDYLLPMSLTLCLHRSHQTRPRICQA